MVAAMTKPSQRALDEHLLQLVGDFLRAADDRVVHLAAAREGDEVARAGIGLA